MSNIDRGQKKIAKDKGSAIRADLLVQGTNDFSIVSKRSVEKLYFPALNEAEPVNGEYFHHFVSKEQRRSPAINRGYWIRMNSIKNCIDSIIKNENAAINTIINLGCGYDPLPFQILDNKFKFLRNGKPGMKFLCIDIDYPELIENKVKMIKDSAELMEIVGEIDHSCKIPGVQLKTDNYAAVGCNLRDIGLFQEQLTLLGLYELNTTSIFIAEVSLAYMLPEHCNPIIQETSKFPKSHFVVLEQLLPTADNYHPFGRTMLHHFKRLSTPLKCVESYSTISHQLQRFQQLGFPIVEARDLLGCWEELFDQDLKSLVKKIEPFDEFEELINYTQHYIVVHASNSMKCCFKNETKILESNHLEKSENFKVRFEEINDPSLLERKFAAIALNDKENIIVTEGLSTIRLNSSLLITKNKEDFKEFVIENHDLPERMCHSLTSLGTNEFILIGGRSAPQKLLKDCWRLTQTKNENYRWSPISDLPTARSRHVAVAISDHEILCFGGLNSLDDETNSFIKYNSLKNLWEDVNITYSFHGQVYKKFPNKRSASMTFDISNQKGYLLGGLNNDDNIDNSLYEIIYDSSATTLRITEIFTHELIGRYGLKLSHINNSLIIIGGVSTFFAFDKFTTVIELDLSSFKIRSIPFNDSLWLEGPMLVGFDIVKFKNNDVCCVGGGAVCFGFGSFWNHKLLFISEQNRDHNSSLENGKWIGAAETTGATGI